jgi:ribonuclease D
MLPDLPSPTLIEEQADLDKLIEILRGEDEIAVDTEADSFFSYREKVCLIQVTALGEDYLIDPLKGMDLSGLGEICADEEKVKIFHDGEYDVLLLGRCYGFRFKNIFDTRVAASALGSTSPGLGSVLEEHFGIVLDKSMQRSNWGERPLSQRQIDYARLDTHFLHELMRNQAHQLADAERRMILDGECMRLEWLDTPQPKFNPDEWVRLKGARALSPDGRQACKSLFILRDRLASESDVPPFRIMNNEALLGAADARPKNVKGLEAIRGFSWKQLRRIGDPIMDALDDADDLGPLNDLPHLPPKDGTGGLDGFDLELHERLKVWRRKMADREGFDASLIMNRHVLIRLVKDRPDTVEDLRDIEGLMPWQFDRYQDGLLDVIELFLDDLEAGRIELNSKRRGRSRD